MPDRRTPSARPVLVGIGELLWDLLPGGRQLGGAPANFAYHARALGAEGIPVSAVGADEPGRDARARLAELGLPDRWVASDPAHPTGAVDVALDARGAPRYTIREGAAWDHLPLTPDMLDLAGRADAVCFGSLGQRSPDARRSIRSFVSAARPGCLRVLDVNLRQAYFEAGLLRELLAASDVLKLNDEERPTLARLLGLPADEAGSLAALADRFHLKLVALTRGADGCLLLAGERRAEHPGFPARVVDTVGAGDAFTAAMVLNLLRGADLDAIASIANRVAAYVCTQAGATPPLPRELAAGSDGSERRPHDIP